MGKSDKENFNFKFQKEDRIPQQMNISSPTGFKDVCLPVGENMGKGIIHLCQNEEGLGYGEFTTRGVEDKLSYFVSYEKRCFKLPFLLTGRGNPGGKRRYSGKNTG